MANLILEIRIFFKLSEKIENFWKFAWRNRILCVKLPERIGIFRKFDFEINFFVKLPEKSKFFDPDPRPQ